MSNLYWSDGTPRSRGNAFDLAPRTVTPLTPEQVKIEANRISCLQRYHKKEALKKASRVNKEDFCISPTPQADADKTARITGKRNEARSQ